MKLLFSYSVHITFDRMALAAAAAVAAKAIITPEAASMASIINQSLCSHLSGW